MFFQIFIMIIVVGVTSCNTEDCRHRMYFDKAIRVKCRMDEISFEYPETVEQLRQSCSMILKALDCVIHQPHECPVPQKIAKLKDILAYGRSICDEDSVTFQKVSRNIGCISAAAKSMKDVCDWKNFTEEEIDTLITMYESLPIEEKYFCSHAVNLLTCANYVIGKRCGQEFAYIVSDFIKNTSFTYSACSEDTLEKLRPYEEALHELFIKYDTTVFSQTDCHERLLEECRISRIPTEFPDTVEELKHGCNSVQEALNCLVKKGDDSCPDVQRNTPEMQQILDFVEPSCQENTPIFQEVSKNLGCLTPAARSMRQVCSWDNFSDEESDLLVNLTTNAWDQGLYICSTGVQFLTCANYVITTRCGSEFKNLVLNIVQELEPHYKHCTEEALEVLRPFKETFEVLLIKHDMFENILND